MQFASLFWLRSAFLPDALHVEPTHQVDGKALFLGSTQSTEPVTFAAMEGSIAYDWIGTTFGTPLVSERFVAILQKHRFTGWDTYQVRVSTETGARIQGFHGLRVKARCGPVDKSKSALVEVPPAVPTGKSRQALRGLYFDLHSWDGSHLFVPSNTRHLIVVESVKEALEEASITNIEFDPLPSVEMPVV